MYRAITRGIAVSVEPSFLDDQSKPQEHYFMWAYRVSIENNGAETVQLRTRYWRITDAGGRVQEVLRELFNHLVLVRGAAGELQLDENAEVFEREIGAA